jgi:hypothetical protein
LCTANTRSSLATTPSTANTALNSVNPTTLDPAPPSSLSSIMANNSFFASSFERAAVASAAPIFNAHSRAPTPILAFGDAIAMTSSESNGTTGAQSTSARHIARLASGGTSTLAAAAAALAQFTRIPGAHVFALAARLNAYSASTSASLSPRPLTPAPPPSPSPPARRSVPRASRARLDVSPSHRRLARLGIVSNASNARTIISPTDSFDDDASDDVSASAPPSRGRRSSARRMPSNPSKSFARVDASGLDARARTVDGVERTSGDAVAVAVARASTSARMTLRMIDDFLGRGPLHTVARATATRVRLGRRRAECRRRACRFVDAAR